MGELTSTSFGRLPLSASGERVGGEVTSASNPTPGPSPLAGRGEISDLRPLTTALNRQNEPRLLWVRFKLLPKMNDVRVDGARVWIVLIAPHSVQQTVAAVRFHG